jgi:four helix bundle protein
MVKFVQALPAHVPRPLAEELVRLGTQIGARVDEACGSPSRRRYLADMTAARRDAGALDYWLRLLAAGDGASHEDIQPLRDEARALHAVLTDICLSARQRLEADPESDDE